MLAAILVLSLTFAEEQTRVSQAARAESGYLVHRVTSPYQAEETLIRVLLPDDLDDRAGYPVVYVLPVEPGLESKYGSGLDELKKLDLHNEHRTIFVAPTFANLPWYADHPTRPELRQETYFIDAVVPFVDRTYPVRPDAGGRLLLGFSKSGRGAFALLMRNRTQQPFLTAGVSCRSSGRFPFLATEFDDGTFGRFGKAAGVA